MSGYISQQDGAPAHHDKDTGLVQRTSKSILGVRYWPGNSPRLEPNREFVGYCAKQHSYGLVDGNKY